MAKLFCFGLPTLGALVKQHFTDILPFMSSTAFLHTEAVGAGATGATGSDGAGATTRAADRPPEGAAIIAGTELTK